MLIVVPSTADHNQTTGNPTWLHTAAHTPTIRKILVSVAVVIFMLTCRNAQADTFGTTPIKYVTWNGVQWSGYIQNIVVQASFNLNGVVNLGTSVIDPDFHHVENGTQDQPTDRRANYMDYVSNDGGHWRATIQAHNDGTARFFHCPQNSVPPNTYNIGACHYDTIINFLTWDGTCLTGTLNGFTMPASGNDPGSPVNVTFQPIPCKH